MRYTPAVRIGIYLLCKYSEKDVCVSIQVTANLDKSNKN